jgi:hypothetical protein
VIALALGFVFMDVQDNDAAALHLVLDDILEKLTKSSFGSVEQIVTERFPKT